LSLRQRSMVLQRLQSLAAVLTLISALIGAPAISAVRNECNLCPTSCPMHQHPDDGHAKAAPPMKCHGAKSHGDEDRHTAPGQPRGLSIARAACGNHGLMPATALPPMLLPAVQPRLIVPVADTAPAAIATLSGRLAEPPDTPPPIRAA
jgi:hypothetical protein